MKGFCRRALLLFLVLGSTRLRAIEPDEVRIRISVKRVLSPTGALPTGSYSSSTEITRVIGKCNDALRKSGASWTIVLTEVVNTQAASAYYTFSSSRMGNFESDAKADRTGFKWRNDAINIYVVDEITDAGGVCSFPSVGPSRELITINSKGILGGSEGWLHEMGHYFNLIHTHEGDLVADTIADPPLPNPFDCAQHDQDFVTAAQQAGASTTDTFNGLHNIMGYHCDPQVLTPLQIVRMRRALLDFRSAVVEPAPANIAPAAQISLPPEASTGAVAFSGAPVTIELSAEGSTDGDGGGIGDLTCRWSLVSGPAGGARLQTPTNGWLRGCSGFGYSDDDDLTVLSDMRNRYMSVFVTRAFTVTSPSSLTAMELDISYDDGFAAYLNGKEVARRNLAANASFSTPAVASVEDREVIDLTAFLGDLVPGTNRLSIEVHNASLDSSDLSLHPILRATRTTGVTTTLIPTRAIWYYQKGSSGAPPASWKDPEFDPARSRLPVTFSKPGVYSLRLTVDDAGPTGNTSSTDVELVVGPGAFVRGDCNQDGEIDVSDAVFDVLELFGGGPASACPDACDLDDSDTRGLTDVIYLLRFLYTAGPEPPAPYPSAGTDPAGDALGCGV